MDIAIRITDRARGFNACHRHLLLVSASLLSAGEDDDAIRAVGKSTPLLPPEIWQMDGDLLFILEAIDNGEFIQWGLLPTSIQFIELC